MYEIFDRLMKERGVTPYRVHKETGVAQSTLSDWKSGKCKPKIDKLKAIADYFGVSVDYLLGEDEPKEKAPAEADVTFDDFTYAMYNESQELTEENKNMLLDMARLLRERQREGK